MSTVVIGAYQTVAYAPGPGSSHKQLVTSKQIGRAISIGIAAQREAERAETLVNLGEALRKPFSADAPPVPGSVEMLVRSVGEYFDGFEKLNKRRNAIPLDAKPPKPSFQAEPHPISAAEMKRRTAQLARYVNEREVLRLKIVNERSRLESAIDRFVDTQSAASPDSARRDEFSEAARSAIGPVVKNFETGEVPHIRRQKDQALAQSVQWQIVRDNVLYIPPRMMPKRKPDQLLSSYPLPANKHG